jgi:cell division transport system permease protein
MMHAYFIAHVQAIQRAIKRLAFQPGTTLLSVMVIGIALTLPLGLHIFLENIVQATNRLDTDPHINVYLQVVATLEDARAVEARIRANAKVQAVKFVARDAAFKEMKRSAYLADLLASLDTNPLPHAFSVRPRISDAASLETLRSELAALPKVEYVLMDFEWAQKLARLASFAERLVAVLAVVFGAAVVFVTGNTIRLQILTQREEIEVSQLIGATRGFIRRPFLYFGALQGLFAGAFAFAIIAAAGWGIDHEVQALAIMYVNDFRLQLFSLETVGWVLFTASLLGWLGAFLSVTQYFGRNAAA